MRYKLIGIDLDGTLLDPHGKPSEATLAAVQAAQEAGALVVPCTGRGWRESVQVLRPVPGLELGVFVTGASIARIDTGESLDFSVLEPHLVEELVAFLIDEPDAVLLYREASLAGHDYLVTGHGELSPQTEHWFQVTGANVHFQRDLTQDDMHHTLRVGMVVPQMRLHALEAKVRQAFADRVLLHHFRAMETTDPDQNVHVMEIFPRGVDKWQGLRWIAREHNIASDAIAAIGDEVNDLSMLRGAACGIAMGNAVDAARDAANHITQTNAEEGVARAIERMLDGRW